MTREELMNLARSEDTSADVLIKLSKHKDVSIRWEVAGNPNTPMEVLEKLTKDEDEGVRETAREEIARREK